MGNFNGQVQSVRRRYDTLRNFLGKNEVHKAGDVLCVSSKNNDKYDIFITADGKSDFAHLYLNYRKGGVVPVGPNSDEKLNTFDEIVAFLEGLPEGSNLKNILDNINTDGLTEEEKETLDAIVNAEEPTEEELEDDWEQAMQNAANGNVDGGGSDTGEE